MTASARKYAFETEFDAFGDVLSESDLAVRYTRADLERAREEGQAAGEAGAVLRAEAAAAEALQELAQRARGALDSMQADRARAFAAAAELALSAARAVVGAALETFGEDRVVNAVAEAFAAFEAAPRVVVRLNPSLMETVRPRLEAFLEEHAFAGALLVRADPACARGDVTIEWAEGGVELNSADALTRVETLVRAALTHSETITR